MEKTMAENAKDEELRGNCEGSESACGNGACSCDGAGDAKSGECGEAEKAENAEKQDGAADEKVAETKAADKKAEDEDLNTKYLRLMADFQNYKRRTEKEKSDIYAYANEKLIGELLDVIDNFDRALAQTDNANDSFVSGMSMIFKQLSEVLTKAGLEEIEALGLEFDPNFHNAVMTEDTDDYESGQVSEVLQKGYMLNKKVVRPSMVKVAN